MPWRRLYSRLIRTIQNALSRCCAATRYQPSRAALCLNANASNAGSGLCVLRLWGITFISSPRAF